jgi:hypothetical protein
MKSTNFILLLTLIVITGCGYDTSQDNSPNINPELSCEDLAKNLDEKIIDSNNPPGNFRIQGFEGVVGGTLISISNDTFIRDHNGYVLTFRGIEKEGKLSLGTVSEESFPYEIGKFYKFDLANKNQYSAALSGAFIDNNLDKLEEINC